MIMELETKIDCDHRQYNYLWKTFAGNLKNTSRPQISSNLAFKNKVKNFNRG